ncbi:MAG: sugar ABC transporter permease, partial [Lachnospiraceae bacterium]|nr:sugar ABC transporter permease [Lachnospiraceae bacterium]
MFKELKRNRQLYLMCLPAIIFLIMFCYIPYGGLWMAFTKYNIKDGIFGSPFVGIANFRPFFKVGGMGLKVTANTLIINFFGLIFGTIFPILIAICFNE